MKEHDWILDLQSTDQSKPREDVASATVYTLRMNDFLRMPVVAFSELVQVDPDLRALLN